jgi:hypothetical protein
VTRGGKRWCDKRERGKEGKEWQLSVTRGKGVWERGVARGKVTRKRFVHTVTKEQEFSDTITVMRDPCKSNQPPSSGPFLHQRACNTVPPRACNTVPPARACNTVPPRACNTVTVPYREVPQEAVPWRIPALQPLQKDPTQSINILQCILLARNMKYES